MATTSMLMAAYSERPLQVIERVIHDEDFLHLYLALVDCLGAMEASGGGAEEVVRRETWLDLSRMLIVPIEWNDEWHERTVARLDRARTFFSADAMARGVGACDALRARGNPLRSACRDALALAHSAGEDFKIYCHRTERDVYEALVPSLALQDANFIHSRTEFAAVGLHDVLVKVGPLRATGRGRVPDAILSAPRSRRVEVIHWSVSRHDAHFGMSVTDTVAPARTRIASGTHPGAAIGQVDLFEDVRTPSTGPEAVTPSRLFVLDGGQCYLMPENGEVWVLGQEQGAEVRVSKVRDVLPGAWLILPDLGLSNGTTVKAEAGPGTMRWKSELARALAHSPQKLVQRLRTLGIKLKDLEGAVRHWAKAPSTVIHAPQAKAHFALLLSALDIVPGELSLSQIIKSRAFGEAWREVARSRGVAIGAGVVESEREREAFEQVLAGMEEEVRSSCMAKLEWYVDLPAGAPVTGRCEFHPVVAVEGGYRAPESAHREIIDLDEADQWRS